MSTVEGLDEDGSSFDPRKSFSNPYIFNTAFARARSLVVAAGNPFILIRAEDAVREPKDCWREFIKICHNQEQFIVAKRHQIAYNNVKKDLNNLISLGNIISYLHN